jgi:AraC family transcriptional regulator of adaptative response/methylated-DNA-[protein]-cysteine methyltransferase
MEMTTNKSMGSFINSLEIELTGSMKSPLAPLYQRGVIPSFAKGRSGGIYGECRDNYETINKRCLPMEHEGVKAFLLDDERWEALVRRDPQACGEFVYGVLTTGVYCRPTCASRLPNRENVRFFRTSKEAEQADFRPCKRCKPEAPNWKQPQTSAVLKACKMIARILTFLEGPDRGGLDLPLDVRGTAFQRRVWLALQEILPGDTVSYADIAGRIGKPKAARAVAQACAANPIAVAIPCHRVVRGNGDLGGYRWGVERKRVLLERESKVTESGTPGQSLGHL